MNGMGNMYNYSRGILPMRCIDNVLKTTVWGYSGII